MTGAFGGRNHPAIFWRIVIQLFKMSVKPLTLRWRHDESQELFLCSRVLIGEISSAFHLNSYDTTDTIANRSDEARLYRDCDLFWSLLSFWTKGCGKCLDHRQLESCACFKSIGHKPRDYSWTEGEDHQSFFHSSIVISWSMWSLISSLI